MGSQKDRKQNPNGWQKDSRRTNLLKERLSRKIIRFLRRGIILLKIVSTRRRKIIISLITELHINRINSMKLTQNYEKSFAIGCQKDNQSNLTFCYPFAILGFHPGSVRKKGSQERGVYWLDSEETIAPRGAWKCKSSAFFLVILTDRPTDQPTSGKYNSM